MNRLLVTDPEICEEMIRERKRLGHDRHDEVWEGVYVVPPPPHLSQQEIIGSLTTAFSIVLDAEGRGQVYPGANVSDQPVHWENNYRVPDVVVVRKKSRAVDRGYFLYGGPDFLVEIQTPEVHVIDKIPFYSRIQVEELLIVERDSRKLRLLRHDGHELSDVEPTPFQGGKWLVGQVLPLAFRRKLVKSQSRIEAARTDGKDGHWLI
jgi:Uma2 family endonuclease